MKEAFVPTGPGGAGQLSLPLAARASLLLDLCDLEDVPAAYVPAVSALWDLVEQLEASTNGALAARQISDTLEIACPHCPRPTAPAPAFATPHAAAPPRNVRRGFALTGWQGSEQGT